MGKRPISSATLIIFCGIGSAQQIPPCADACAKMLIPQQYQGTTTTSMDEAYRNWACRKDFLDASTNGTVNANLTIPVLGGIGLGGGATNQEHTVKLSEYCQDTTMKITTAAATNLTTITISDEKAKIYVDCLHDQCPAKSQDVIKIDQQEIGIGGADVIAFQIYTDKNYWQGSKLPRVKLITPTNLNCTPQKLHQGEAIQAPPGLGLSCIWSSDTAHGALVQVDTDTAGSWFAKVGRILNCVDFSGRWRTSQFLLPMQISGQASCDFEGYFESADINPATGHGSIQHTLIGHSEPGSSTAKIRVRREAPNCTMDLLGTLQKSGESLLYTINGTDGSCPGVPNFAVQNQVLTWYR